jgi:hypothetical protein
MIKEFDELRCMWKRRYRAIARFAACLSVVLLAAGDGASQARASGLVIELPNVVANPGSSGSFDVLLADTDPAGSPGYHIAGDDIKLSLSAPGGPFFVGVSFTNVTINTTSAPYIFVESSTQALNVPLSLDAFPNTSFSASDTEFASQGYRVVNPGDVFGLMHVSYTVSTNLSENNSLVIDATTTTLSDESGKSVPFTVQGGLLTVPGPPSWTLVATGLLFCLAAWRFGPGCLA